MTGTVRDCRGDPMAGIEVQACFEAGLPPSRARGPRPNGSYRLAARAAGTYRVTVGLTVTGKGGSGTRRDTRAATVRVR